MSTTAPPATQLRDIALGIGLLAGPANVIMQLARPGVGYGVVESRVDSGNIFKHPIKRTRTTLTYLAVATMGTEEERRQYRRAVNRAHARVHSTSDSPVSYNAFDPDLQLWVAACLYQGFADIYRLLGPPTDQAVRERLYREASVLGTTLQVPEERWPADLAEFERYWRENLATVEIDDTVRTYLTDLIKLKPFPALVQALFGPLNIFLTTGFLPEPFRSEMLLPWDRSRQQAFDALMRALRLAVRVAPPVLRAFPFNLAMVDLRRRIRSGRPLV